MKRFPGCVLLSILLGLPCAFVAQEPANEGRGLVDGNGVAFEVATVRPANPNSRGPLG